LGEDTTRTEAFRLDAGEPAVLLGTDTGPNPAEYLLHALAACLTTTLVYSASARKVRLTEVSSTFEGDMDVRGCLGLDDAYRNGFTQIRGTFTIKGDAPFHNIVVELAKPAPYGFKPGSRDGVAGYTQVLDNERVRAWRLVLPPGAEAAAIAQAAPGIRVIVAGGEIVERVAGRPDRGIAPHAGEFFWQDAGVTRAVKNVGVTGVELVEVELK